MTKKKRFPLKLFATLCRGVIRDLKMKDDDLILRRRVFPGVGKTVIRYVVDETLSPKQICYRNFIDVYTIETNMHRLVGSDIVGNVLTLLRSFMAILNM